MEAVTARTPMTGRRATHDETLSALQLFPIPEQDAEAHMAAELAKCPKATPFYGVLKHLPSVMPRALAGSICATVLLALSGVLAQSLVLLASAVGTYLLMVLIHWTSMRLDKTVIYDKAAWTERTFEEVSHLASPDLRALIARVERAVGPGDVYCYVLEQNTVVLDPVWWFEHSAGKSCFAITDEHKRIVRSA